MGLVALATVLADQASKAWALGALAGGRTVDLLGSALSLRLVHNSGAAFSIGEGSTIVMTVIAVGIVAVVLRAARKLGSTPWAVVLGLVVGGALGNLIDRFTRPPGPGRGAVVDFIDYGGLFVGNVADIAIVGAALVIALLSLRGVGISGRPA